MTSKAKANWLFSDWLQGSWYFLISENHRISGWHETSKCWDDTRVSAPRPTPVDCWWLSEGPHQKDSRTASRLSGEEEDSWFTEIFQGRQNKSGRVEGKRDKENKLTLKTKLSHSTDGEIKSQKMCSGSPDTWSQNQDLEPHLSGPIHCGAITTSCGLQIITSKYATQMQPFCFSPGFLGSLLFLILYKNNTWN